MTGLDLGFVAILTTVYILVSFLVLYVAVTIISRVEQRSRQQEYINDFNAGLQDVESGSETTKP